MSIYVAKFRLEDGRKLNARDSGDPVNARGRENAFEPEELEVDEEDSDVSVVEPGVGAQGAGMEAAFEEGDLSVSDCEAEPSAGPVPHAKRRRKVTMRVAFKEAEAFLKEAKKHVVGENEGDGPTAPMALLVPRSAQKKKDEYLGPLLARRPVVPASEAERQTL